MGADTSGACRSSGACVASAACSSRESSRPSVPGNACNPAKAITSAAKGDQITYSLVSYLKGLLAFAF